MHFEFAYRDAPSLPVWKFQPLKCSCVARAALLSFRIEREKLEMAEAVRAVETPEFNISVGWL